MESYKKYPLKDFSESEIDLLNLIEKNLTIKLETSVASGNNLVVSAKLIYKGIEISSDSTPIWIP